MSVGDGLLVRIKPRGHRLSFAQARAIAALARGLGNGALNLTARGNIQIRGLVEADLPAVTDALASHGLLDATPEGEAVRNVASNPLAGADPTVLVDLRAATAALEDRLATDAGLWRLPAKFAWSVEDGGALPVAEAPTDVRFAAWRDADGAPHLIVTLDGARDAAVAPVGTLVDVAVRLAGAFLALCAEHRLPPHRMRDLVATRGARAMFAQAGLMQFGGPPPPPAASPIGVGMHPNRSWSVVEASPAFGFLDAALLARFAMEAEAAGASGIRLTSRRSLIAPALSEAGAAALAAALAGTGLILDPGDPRLSIAACVGQPACRRATTPVPADAARLAALALPGRIHVSGCAKGCARAEPSPVTLVGRDGLYDLVIDGRAGDAPIRRGLPLEALLTMLPARLESAP